jgi:hypothetical protein
LEIYGQVDREQLRVAGQYENPWLIRAGRGVKEVETTGLGVPLGISREAVSGFRHATLRLEDTAVLMLFSSAWLAVLDQHREAVDQVGQIVRDQAALSSERLLTLVQDQLRPLVPEPRSEDLLMIVVKRRVVD